MVGSSGCEVSILRRLVLKHVGGFWFGSVRLFFLLCTGLRLWLYQPKIPLRPHGGKN